MDRDFSTLAGAGTDNGNQPVWLNLEFGKTYFIQKVVIYYRFYTYWPDPESYWCAQSVANFKACVNNENSVDVSVYKEDMQKKSCGTLQLTYGLEQSDQIYRLICNTDGDTVKLSKSAGKIFVGEVVVININKGKFNFKFSTPF